MPASLTPERVVGYPADADYPADKDRLVSAAEQSGALDEVLQSLRARGGPGKSRGK